MAYQKRVYTDVDVEEVTYEDMNRIEEGIYQADQNKVDKVDGKGLSTEDYTTEEKEKLASVDKGANKYTHPASHQASMIVQDASRRFVTDAEKTTWNEKETTAGALEKANAALQASKNYADEKVGALKEEVAAKTSEIDTDIAEKVLLNGESTNVNFIGDSTGIKSINGVDVVADSSITEKKLSKSYVAEKRVTTNALVLDNFNNSPSIEVTGNSYIVSTRNFLYIPDGTYTDGNITVDAKDGILKINGTANQSVINLNTTQYDIIPNKKYTVKNNDASFSGIGIIVRDETNTNIYNSISGYEAKILDVSSSKIAKISLYIPSGVYNNLVLNPRMLLGEFTDQTANFIKSVLPKKYSSTNTLSSFEGIIISSCDANNVVASYNGNIIKEIEDRVYNLENNVSDNSIVCWGDSLTAGAGANAVTINGLHGATMPSALAQLLNYDYPPNNVIRDGKHAVYNMGVGGEDSRTIACRQGGLLMYVNDITIPTSGAVTFSKILCQDGKEIFPCRQNWYGQRQCFEPCMIGGIEGNLTYSSDTSLYTFTRLTSGTTLVINRPMQVVTKPSRDRKNDIMILQIGHNGGWDNDYTRLIGQYRAMIEWSNCDKYLIIGDSNGTALSMAEWEKKLQDEFGHHFINNREYLSKYGMEDRGLTPNEDDLSKMANGEIPLSLKSDSTHYNSYGYYTQAEMIFKRGKDLGYW